jgi:hypothetical protein
MNRRTPTHIVGKCLVTIGIVLMLLLAGAAPSDHPNGIIQLIQVLP